MASFQQPKDPMEYIWEKVPKTKEGFIHYLPGDIPYLYKNGFVDTTRFSYDEWRAAFDDCRQADDSCLVSREKFLSLRGFRYEGPVFRPFEAAKVREGEWTDSELGKLFTLSIRPSSGIPEEVYWNSIRALKKQGLEKNGNLIVNAQVKRQLAYLIERFPSPRRKLEQEVERIREERESKFREVSGNRDKSNFVSGKLASEDKMESFTKLQTKVARQPKIPITRNKTLDLKSLKKPPRKISG